MLLQAILSQYKKTRRAREGTQSELSEDVAAALAELIAEIDNAPDVQENENEEVSDAAREAADDAVIESIDEKHPEVLVSADELREGQLAVHKVR